MTLAGTFFEQYGMIIILGVFFVLMIVMTIIPQRKQKKQQQQMMDSLGVGAKVMTIGGFVGTIVGSDNQNFFIDIGVDGNSQIVTVVKSAIRQRLDVANVAPVKAEANENANESKADEKEDTSFFEKAKAEEDASADKEKKK